MRLILSTAALAAALALPGGAPGAQAAPYWSTIRGCSHGHPSRVSYRAVGLLLRHTRPTVDRAKVRHYTRCVATRAKRRAIVRKAVRPGWRWRASYPQVFAIRYNRFPAWVHDYLDALRPCEGGRYGYAADTGNSFYGAYQFTWSTWAGVGGLGNAAHAAPAEQDYRAAVLLTTGGAGHWPNCP